MAAGVQKRQEGFVLVECRILQILHQFDICLEAFMSEEEESIIFLKRITYFSVKWSVVSKHGSSYILLCSANVNKEIIFLGSFFGVLP